MSSVAHSVPPAERISGLEGGTQALVLLLGLPAALASVEVGGACPAFVPDLLRVAAAAGVWGATRLILAK